MKFKTTDGLAQRLVEHLATEHSYDVPEVLVTPVAGGHTPYLTWVAAQTG